MAFSIMKSVVVAFVIASQASAFSPTSWAGYATIRSNNANRGAAALSPLFSSSTSTSETSMDYSPVFDFTGNVSLDEKSKSIASFERIDDAIMGGISLSALKDVEGQPYASWSGVCRTDGGGFCGMRTLPFKEKLDVSNQDGVYVNCKLASDDEPERRVWKLTVRTDTSRGEQVYQAMFDLAKASEDGSMTMVKVPFASFQLVRGPRLVPDGPPLDTKGGLFQLGMTMSKFKIGEMTTELENFRPGFFDLHLSEIGFYKDVPVEESSKAAVALAPDTLSKEEAAKKRPLPLRLLLPVAKIFFSETANRRKSAMNILREKRNMTRMQAILFGIKARRNSIGLLRSTAKTAGILGIDSARTVLKNFLKVVLIFPLKIVNKIIRSIKKALGMKVKPSMKE